MLGAKLRELMIENDMKFPLVEMALKKTKETSIGQTKVGRWVTKHYLLNVCSWTKTLGVMQCLFNRDPSSEWPRKMADKAFEWAGGRKLIRVNEMHGEEEAKLILDDTFEWVQRESETTTESVSLMVEDPWRALQTACCMCTMRCPIDTNRFRLLNYKDENGDALSSTDNIPERSASLGILTHHGGDEVDPAELAATNSGSFKRLGCGGFRTRVMAQHLDIAEAHLPHHPGELQCGGCPPRIHGGMWPKDRQLRARCGLLGISNIWECSTI